MEHHHKILFPAFLILFASFLAFSLGDLNFADFISKESSPITGYAVVAGSSCEIEDSTVLGMYADENSHIFMIGSGESTGLCAQFSSALTISNTTRECDADFTNLIGYAANGTGGGAEFLSNAHFYAPETSPDKLPNYFVPICYDEVECHTAPSCEVSEECLFSFEGASGEIFNAHAADCGTYNNQLCCNKIADDFCGALNCDDFDINYNNISLGLNTMSEAEVSASSCTSSCSGISCCEQSSVTCDGSATKQCKNFYDLIGYPAQPFNNPDNNDAICYTSNFGQFLWGFPNAEIKELACEDTFDNDCDGLKDGADPDCILLNDNCPLHPNNATLGTCINVVTKSNPNPTLNPVTNNLTCLSDIDCVNKTVKGIIVDYCELTQANQDGSATSGDSCGNACDVDSSDGNTCVEEDDGGGIPPSDCAGALIGASFTWNPSGSVERGDLVEIVLNLAGNTNCNGITFGISVINVDANPGDLDYFSVSDPNPLNISGSSGKTTWYAENNNPGPNPKIAKWKAKGVNIGGIVVPPSTILSVNATESYCGDGVKNTSTGEQCDDGDTEDGDGCSKNCLKEGIVDGGGSDDCSSYCVKGTSVCGSNGVSYCGDYNGDGCNELKFGDSCTGKTCNSDFGNCVSSSCTVKNFATISDPSCSGSGASWVCGKWSNCINGERTRVCKECSNGACGLQPVETIGCSIEPSTEGSFFDLWSVLLAVVILGLYYFFRNSKVIVK